MVVADYNLDGVAAIAMVRGAIAESAGGECQRHHIQDSDQVTLFTHDLDYPMCAIDIVALTQCLNHMADPAWADQDLPDIYHRMFDMYGEQAPS